MTDQPNTPTPATDEDLLQALAEINARTTTCPHDYTYRDTCPVCDA